MRESPSRDGQISVGNGTARLATFRRHESVILTSKRQMWYTSLDRYRKAWNMQIAAGMGRDMTIRDLDLRGTGTVWENGDSPILKEISGFLRREREKERERKYANYKKFNRDILTKFIIVFVMIL